MGTVSSSTSDYSPYQSDYDELVLRQKLESAIIAYKAADTPQTFIDGLVQLRSVFEEFPTQFFASGADQLFVKEGYVPSLAKKFAQFTTTEVAHTLLSVLYKINKDNQTVIIHSGIPHTMHICIQQYGDDEILVQYVQLVIGDKQIVFDNARDTSDIGNYARIVRLSLKKLPIEQIGPALSFLAHYALLFHDMDIFHEIADCIPDVVTRAYENEHAMVELFQLLFNLLMKSDEDLRLRCEFIVDGFIECRNRVVPRYPFYQGLVIRYYALYHNTEEVVDKIMTKQLDGGIVTMLEGVIDETEILKLLELLSYLCKDKRTKEICKKNRGIFKKSFAQLEKQFGKSSEVKTKIHVVEEKLSTKSRLGF
jgi:hypothetical protein